MSGGTDSQIPVTPSLLQRWQFKGSNCAKARQVQGQKSSNEAKLVVNCVQLIVDCHSRWHGSWVHSTSWDCCALHSTVHY